MAYPLGVEESTCFLCLTRAGDDLQTQCFQHLQALSMQPKFTISDHTAHFSNRCDIYRVVKLVHITPSDNHCNWPDTWLSILLLELYSQTPSSLPHLDPPPPPHTHTLTHTHSHIHSYRHMYTACLHAHKHTHTCAHAHTHKHAHPHTHTHVPTHMPHAFSLPFFDLFFVFLRTSQAK